MNTIQRLAMAGTWCVVAACAAPYQTTSLAPLAPPSGRLADHGTRLQISPTKLQSGLYSTLYDLIQTERPYWLQRRGSEYGSGGVQVYYNGQRLGDVRELKAIRPEHVAAVEFQDAFTATTLWGTGHSYGAIVLRAR